MASNTQTTQNGLLSIFTKEMIASSFLGAFFAVIAGLGIYYVQYRDTSIASTSKLEKSVEAITSDVTSIKIDLNRFEDKIDKRFEAVDKRFESLEKRMDNNNAISAQNHAAMMRAIGQLEGSSKK